MDELVERHFKPSKLKGYGKMMASNEIVSHCELLTSCGDLTRNGKGAYQCSGNRKFEMVLNT